MVMRSEGAFNFRKNHYIFDQMNGAQSQLPAFLINIHKVTDLATAEDYVSRLEGIDEVMDQLVAQAKERQAMGVLPPDWVYPYVISDSRSEEHTSELQSLMRISYAVFCLKKKKHNRTNSNRRHKKNN